MVRNLRNSAFGELVSLSALFHDVGKVIRRSGVNKKHAQAGHSFIKDVLGEAGELQYILNVILYHHESKINLEDIMQKNVVNIVKIADHLNAQERYYSEDQPRAWKENIPLLSIMSEIQNIKDNNKPSYKFFDRISELVITPSEVNILFPQKELNSVLGEDDKVVSGISKLVLGGYQAIRNRLRKSLHELKTRGLIREDFILIPFEKLFTYIPSDTTIQPKLSIYPDISLFDHSKMTATFARALYNSLFRN